MRVGLHQRLPPLSPLAQRVWLLPPPTLPPTGAARGQGGLLAMCAAVAASPSLRCCRKPILVMGPTGRSPPLRRPCVCCAQGRCSTSWPWTRRCCAPLSSRHSASLQLRPVQWQWHHRRAARNRLGHRRCHSGRHASTRSPDFRGGLPISSFAFTYKNQLIIYIPSVFPYIHILFCCAPRACSFCLPHVLHHDPA